VKTENTAQDFIPFTDDPAKWLCQKDEIIQMGSGKGEESH
jgi:hypothetical protein